TRTAHWCTVPPGCAGHSSNLPTFAPEWRCCWRHSVLRERVSSTMSARSSADTSASMSVSTRWAHRSPALTIADTSLAEVPKEVALAVGVADCVPVFIAHPSGIVALLHSGWRGTAAHITTEAIAALARYGLPPDELAIHLGPAICGRCYEVSADVREQLTGQPVTRAGHVDLRSLIAEHAGETGVQKISVSAYCTKCDNDRFFSHRAGDKGRQVGVIAAQA